MIRSILKKADLLQSPAQKVELFRQAGTLYLERSSNQAEAIKCFEQLLEYDAGDIDAIERLKKMYEKRRDWEKLIRTMQREGRSSSRRRPVDSLRRDGRARHAAAAQARRVHRALAKAPRGRPGEPERPQEISRSSMSAPVSGSRSPRFWKRSSPPKRTPPR